MWSYNYHDHEAVILQTCLAVHVPSLLFREPAGLQAV